MKNLILLCFVLVISITFNANGQSKEKECLKNESDNQKQPCRFKDVSLRLEIVDEDLYGEATTNFVVGQKIYVRVFALQRGEESISFLTKNRFIQYKLVLLKDGVELALLSSVADNTKSALKQEEESMRGGGISILLTPNKETKIGLLDLTEWFGHLEEGIYQLDVEFIIDKQVIKSEANAFEIKLNK